MVETLYDRKIEEKKKRVSDVDINSKQLLVTFTVRIGCIDRDEHHYHHS